MIAFQVTTIEKGTYTKTEIIDSISRIMNSVLEPKTKWTMLEHTEFKARNGLRNGFAPVHSYFSMAYNILLGEL